MILRILLLTFYLSMTNSALANALKNHHSPYLAMHGNDPIHWMEWSNEVLKQAQKENKLIFISVGYYACHWCHVMHRESFSNKDIARLLNKHYIAVKVDRELNPILDKRLIDFVSATQGHAGWPLSIFMTPQGDPLIGATYMPKAQFARVLTGLSKEWKKDSKLLSQQAKEQNERLRLALQSKERQGKKTKIAISAPLLIKQIMANADTFTGGFGQQSKFPSTTQLHALMTLNKDKKDKEIDQFIHLTLNAMATKGLHDELAGGFYRYTVDQEWDTPHFEKMLYNNATLAILYADAAQQYHSDNYRQIAIETLQFLTQSMQEKQGAFIASLSAVDNKGIEGGYYLWNTADIKKLLTAEEFKLAKKLWQLKDKATNIQLKGEYDIALIAKDSQLSPTILKKYLATIRTKLLRHRQSTRQLPRDNKLLTAWNGLALAAFSRVNDKQFNNHAQALAQFLISLWDGKQLYRSSAKQQAGTLQDYASAAWGLLSWAEQSNSQQAKTIGLALLNKAWTDFYTHQQWIPTKHSTLKQGVAETHMTDSAYPAAETLLLRASFLSKQPFFIKKATQVLNFSSQFLEENPYSYASLIELAAQQE